MILSAAIMPSHLSGQNRQAQIILIVRNLAFPKTTTGFHLSFSPLSVRWSYNLPRPALKILPYHVWKISIPGHGFPTEKRTVPFSLGLSFCFKFYLRVTFTLLPLSGGLLTPAHFSSRKSGLPTQLPAVHPLPQDAAEDLFRPVPPEWPLRQKK